MICDESSDMIEVPELIYQKGTQQPGAPLTLNSKTIQFQRLFNSGYLSQLDCLHSAFTLNGGGYGFSEDQSSLFCFFSCIAFLPFTWSLHDGVTGCQPS